MTGKMTGKDVRERFEEVARTLRALPDKDRPNGYQTAWPEVVRAAVESYGYDPARAPRITPSPDQVSRMEQCFTWLSWLEPAEARIVWLRAEGVRWKLIAGRVGYTREHASRLWIAALEAVANRLNRPPRTRRRDSGQPGKAAVAESEKAAAVHNPDYQAGEYHKKGFHKGHE